MDKAINKEQESRAVHCIKRPTYLYYFSINHRIVTFYTISNSMGTISYQHINRHLCTEGINESCCSLIAQLHLFTLWSAVLLNLKHQINSSVNRLALL